jgi:hypothetical protein
MRRLKEVDGDNKHCEESSGQIKLDEKVVDRSEIERKQEDQSIRVVETTPGNYKTLQKLHG